MKKRARAQPKKITKKQPPSSTLYATAVSAGFGTPGDDHVEQTLDINEHIVRNATATFFVRVSGDSMEGAHITTGDILVVDRSVTPKSGMIVVAAVFGELVVKRISRKGNVLLLVSEKEGYEPIRVESEGDCVMWAVVVGVVRKLV